MNLLHKYCTPITSATLAAMCMLPTSSYAAEGASSLYLPGLTGDIFMAVAPKPGVAIADIGYYQTGSASAAVLQGAVTLGIDMELMLNLVSVSYTSPEPVFGGVYSMSAAVPFGHLTLDASLSALGRTLSASGDTSGLADSAFTPISLYWNSGKVSYKFSETIMIPTGDYDVNKALNMGLNRWGFDTVGAMTYFDPEKGFEASFAAGIMLNTENDATDYKTGAEFHLDFAANHFFSESFAAGIRGYYYHQITGDSGSGAVLGDFKGEAFGIGPGFVWIPKFGGGNLAVTAKWVWDIYTVNRFDTQTGSVAVAWTF